MLSILILINTKKEGMSLETINLIRKGFWCSFVTNIWLNITIHLVEITIKGLFKIYLTILFSRLIFANFTSSLLVVNSTLLAIAGLGVLVGGAILLALYYLANVSQSSSSYGHQYSNYQQYSRGFRSEDGGKRF